MLFEFAGFSQPFSDMVQNITSATYKGWVGESRGKVKGVVGWLRLPFRYNGTSCCAKGAINCHQTTLQGKVGHPITVMDDWERFHTDATLLEPTKHCHLIRAHQALPPCY